MTEEKLKLIKEKFPDAALIEGKNWTEVTIKSDHIVSFCKFIREDEQMQFNYLFNMTAVDWKEFLTCIYHLENTDNGDCIIIKTVINDKENPLVDSLSSIWPSAEFYEREVYDLFGIRFNNHPDLRRIFLEEDWVGFPLRKDYIDEINIIER
jgi:NADH-quinone oxidoreductase subunit C